jgi:hypothetical protein
LGANFPIILVAQEIFGLHEHIRDIARRFAKLGFLAIAPDFLVRYGDPQDAPDMEAIRAIVAKVPDAETMEISIRRSHTPRRKAATPNARRSPAFAGAGASPGSMRRIIPGSSPAFPGMGGWMGRIRRRSHVGRSTSRGR